jgi:hypothetical protein
MTMTSGSQCYVIRRQHRIPEAYMASFFRVEDQGKQGNGRSKRLAVLGPVFLI